MTMCLIALAAFLGVVNTVNTALTAYSAFDETKSGALSALSHIVSGLFLFDFSGEPTSIFAISMGFISVFSITLLVVSSGDFLGIWKRLAKKQDAEKVTGTEVVGVKQLSGHV